MPYCSKFPEICMYNSKTTAKNEATSYGFGELRIKQFKKKAKQKTDYTMDWQFFGCEVCRFKNCLP